MKFFALLLFSLEFLAPAMLMDMAATESNHGKVQLINGAHNQTFLFSILTEEITENEEGREGQKDSLLLKAFDFESVFLKLQSTSTERSKYSSITSQQFDTQPALFKLNCSFLI